MMKLLPFISGILLLICNATPTFSQNYDLRETFAKRYLIVKYGTTTSTAQLKNTANSSQKYDNIATGNYNINVGFGFTMEQIFPEAVNLFGEFNVTTHHLTNSLEMINLVDNKLVGVSYSNNFWNYSFQLKKYYNIYKDRLTFSPFLGVAITQGKDPKPSTTPYGTNSTLDADFRLTGRQFSGGILAGMDLNLKIAKRFMVFAEYRFQKQFTNQFNLIDIRYDLKNGNPPIEYTSRILPRLGSINIGINISLENSLFYE